MSVHLKAVAELNCNHCPGEKFTVFAIHRPLENAAELTPEFVRRQAASAGWTRGCGSQDLCPQCADAWRDADVEQDSPEETTRC